MSPEQTQIFRQACQLAHLDPVEMMELYKCISEEKLIGIIDPQLDPFTKYIWEIPNSIDDPHVPYGIDRLFSGSHTWAFEGMCAWIKAFGWEAMRKILTKQDDWALEEQEYWIAASEMARQLAEITPHDED